MDRKKAGVAAAVAVGGTALGLGIAWLLREKAAPEPDYRVLASERDFEIRSYPALRVAETVVHGDRSDALERGYALLSDYLDGKSRDGEKIAMHVPVMQDSGNPMASDPPVFDDSIEGGWRVRFVMPEGPLPAPPEGVKLTELPARRVGVVAFKGGAGDERLAEEEDRLRGWLVRRGEETASTDPEYAFYNSPMIPPPLRRNEILLPLT